MDASFFGKDQYDPTNPLYRYDYWGEPKNTEKSRKERMADTHNKSIVGKGTTVWSEMSYEDCIKAQSKGQQGKEVDDVDTKQGQGAEEEEEDDDDIDFSILSSLGNNLSDQLNVNGTESSRISEEGKFEN